MNDQKWVEKAKAVYDMAQKVHVLGLKFLMTKQTSTAERLCNIIYEMVSTERDYLPNVLGCLKNNVADQML